MKLKVVSTKKSEKLTKKGMMTVQLCVPLEAGKLVGRSAMGTITAVGVLDDPAMVAGAIVDLDGTIETTHFTGEDGEPATAMWFNPA